MNNRYKEETRMDRAERQILEIAKKEQFTTYELHNLFIKIINRIQKENPITM